MVTKSELTKFLSFPMLLIGSGSFIGVIGWMGLAQAAESILFFVGSALFSFSGSMATLCGLMSLERPPPSPTKLRQLKADTAKHLKMQYPSYILNVEKLKQKYQELYAKLPELLIFCEAYRTEIRNLRLELTSFEKRLQANLRNQAQTIDIDSPDGIAKKILWSEKQIQLTHLNEFLEKLSGYFKLTDLEAYRVELMHVNTGLTQLDRGIEFYRELMILCHKLDDNFKRISSVKEKVDKTNDLMERQNKRLQDLSVEMDAKFEEAKSELFRFQNQLDDFLNFLIDDV